MVGLSLDAFNHTTKLQEFSKIFTPNKFRYNQDGSEEGKMSGLDLGFGMAYESNGLVVGIGINKLNRPEKFLYPDNIIDTGSISNPTIIDTTVIIGKGVFALENNINVMYTWDANRNIRITHSLHLANFRFGELDYIGFQNVAEIASRHALGLGAFYNGSAGFIITGGFGVTENLRLEASAFIVEDLNYDFRTEDYASSGIAPLIEGSLQFRF